MTWEKAPRRVHPFDVVMQLTPLSIIWGFALTRDVWWWWALAAIASAGYVVWLGLWVQEYRAYRAWTKWDESGGPDAKHGGGPA